ncbi:MAG: EAL domain-containing protein [Terracidiphilus sp.]|jgi:sensor c-di-GMP phosphodiesterase-like protein
MRTIQQRVLIALLVTILAAACGTGAGYLLGVSVATRQAQFQLRQEANHLIAQENAFLTETFATLKKMSSSPFPYCSDAEVSYFRKLLFQTDYLRDGGRIRNGRIDCSATLSRADLPSAPLKPDFSMPGGSKVYRETGPLQVGNRPTFGLQFNDLYVVINSGAAGTVDSSQLPYILTVTPASGSTPARLLSTAPQPDDAAFSKEGAARIGDTLYFTRCTPDGRSCVTTHTTIRQAAQAGHYVLWLCMAQGGLAGALFGFACSLFYQRSRGMEQQLRRAIQKDQLQFVYQPIVSLPDGKIVGAEALARWTDEEGFVVAPDIFIKIAEDHGFVDSITALAVRHVLRDFAATFRAYPELRVSVNVAASDLSDHRFLAMLESSLEEAGVNANNLAIEITESSTARHEVAIETIRQLHEKGHSVHIDDFGTGYSSLSYLQDLAIDTIKIDRSFTHSIGTDAVNVAILPQILAMAAVLNLQVIAEGVQTSEQANYFAAAGDGILAQGWLSGRAIFAIPASDFQKLLLAAPNRNQPGSEELASQSALTQQA